MSVVVRLGRSSLRCLSGLMPSAGAMALLSGVLLAAGPAPAATIYFCKSYSGGTFWAAAHCSKHQALIERIVSVPDGLPFEQQVQIGEGARAEAGSIPVSPPAPAPAPAATVRTEQTATPPVVDCRAIDQRIASLDAMARQPQSGATQDWITTQRRSLRDLQFRHRCR